MRLAVVALVAALSVIVGLVWTQQRRLIYFPFGDVTNPETFGIAGVTAVSFPTADGLTLNG
ncbi:MAG: alpha/beta hydrolase, partial [Vicinamibacterales bacterium]